MRHDIIDYIEKECNKNNKPVDVEVIEMIKRYFEEITE